jgi:hypothetical protein
LGFIESEGNPSCCVGFDEEFMALLKEVSCNHKVSPSSSKLGNKGSRELKRLECSINYDLKVESSSCGKGKGRGFLFLNEARFEGEEPS